MREEEGVWRVGGSKACGVHFCYITDGNESILFFN